MKKIFSLVILLVTLLSLTLNSYADDRVIYSGDSGRFIFEPGSKYSPTDLFDSFKGVMPGDSITQQITVRNDASNKVKVKIYMRSLGAKAGSEDLLSRLSLKVAKSEENTMAYMFDAAASETAQLTDWVLLGTLYSGGEVNLDVTLNVPTSLGNDYSSDIGYLDWEFMVEELPIEPTDPEAPETGDSALRTALILVPVCTAVLFFIILIFKRRRTEDDSEE